MRWRSRTLVFVVVACGIMSAARSVRADNVDSLVDQLKSDDSDKVRLSAALNLAKLGDTRAKVILAMSKALLNDSDKDVRGACAVGLGKLVNSSTKSSIKGLVVANLKQAVANDASDFVKKSAQGALSEITGDAGSSTSTGNTGTVSGGGGGIYVNVGPMASKTGSGQDDKLRALMFKVAQDTMSKTAAHMTMSWPGGSPSKAALAAKGVAGFYIDGTLNTLAVKTSGGGSTISCKVSMLLADFPDKNMFGFLNGGASVTAGASQSDQALAGQDCVQAVVENLISNKIVPTICSKAGGTCP